MRCMVFALMGLVLAGTAGAQSDKADKKAETKRPRYTIVRGWRGKVGEEARLVNAQGASVYAATGPSSWYSLKTAMAAKDKVGVDQMVKAKSAAEIPNLTPVLLLKEYEHVRGVGYVGTTRVDDIRATAWEARVKEGKLKGQVVIVGSDYVHKVIGLSNGSASDKKASKSSKTFKADRPANKASNAFQAAKKLDAAGKRTEAVKAYQAVIRDFAEFPEARMAKARVEALTSK